MNHNDLSRRDLIKTLGALGLLSTTPLFSSKVFSQSQKRLGVAVVGLGSYGGGIISPALQLTQHCYLAGIVTGSPEKIPVWQEKYKIPDGNVYNYETMHQMADNPDIDVVYITLPTGLHKQYSVIGAEAGKHVWCEKPMAMNAAECEEIIAACKKNKVKLSIGYRMQHEPNTQRIIQMAKTKPYGQIEKITSGAGYRSTADSYHWRADPKLGGGAMYDMGVYPLNAVRYTAGEEPISVTAREEPAVNPLYKDVDETMHFALEFPSGCVAECTTSYAKSMNFLHAQCEKGWYELRPFQSYHGVQGKTSDGTLLNAPIDNQQAKQMDDDALAILNDSPLLVPGEEGLKDIRIVEAIFKAAKENKSIRL